MWPHWGIRSDNRSLSLSASIDDNDFCICNKKKSHLGQLEVQFALGDKTYYTYFSTNREAETKYIDAASIRPLGDMVICNIPLAGINPTLAL